MMKLKTICCAIEPGFFSA